MSEKPLKVFDIFSGIGGFGLGLQRAGMEISAFCEMDEFCRGVLTKHWPDKKIYGDISEVTKESLAKDGIDFDIICGGFPCQDISIGNITGKGILGERSGLWSEFARLIEETKPKYALIENVPLLLSKGIGVILHDLSKIGYDATWTMYDSKFFGVPHRRRRVYILASRDGIPCTTDIFQNRERNSELSKGRVDTIEKEYRKSFTGSNSSGEFAYFTKQRIDEWAECGVSSALCKRDYKEFTDIIVQDNLPRRVTPEERMLLQGFPFDWINGVKGYTKTNAFRSNGMTVPVVEHIGRLINEI